MDHTAHSHSTEEKTHLVGIEPMIPAIASTFWGTGTPALSTQEQYQLTFCLWCNLIYNVQEINFVITQREVQERRNKYQVMGMLWVRVSVVAVVGGHGWWFGSYEFCYSIWYIVLSTRVLWNENGRSIRACAHIKVHSSSIPRVCVRFLSYDFLPYVFMNYKKIHAHVVFKS